MSILDNPEFNRKFQQLREQEQRKQAEVDQQIDTFILLRSAGKTLRECMEQLDISLGSASNWNYKFRAEIAALQNDRLLKTHKLGKEDRMAHQSILLNKLYQALENQDFSQLAAKDLFTMMKQLWQEHG